MPTYLGQYTGRQQMMADKRRERKLARLQDAGLSEKKIARKMGRFDTKLAGSMGQRISDRASLGAHSYMEDWLRNRAKHLGPGISLADYGHSVEKSFAGSPYEIAPDVLALLGAGGGVAQSPTIPMENQGGTYVATPAGGNMLAPGTEPKVSGDVPGGYGGLYPSDTAGGPTPNMPAPTPTDENPYVKGGRVDWIRSQKPADWASMTPEQRNAWRAQMREQWREYRRAARGAPAPSPEPTPTPPGGGTPAPPTAPEPTPLPPEEPQFPPSGPPGPIPPVDTEGGGGPTMGGEGQFPEEPPDPVSQAITDTLMGLITGTSYLSPDEITGGIMEAIGAQGMYDIIQSGGYDPGLLFEMRKNLREQMEGEYQAGTQTLQEQLAGRGITGGGTERDRLVQFRQSLQQDMNQKLRDLTIEMGTQAGDRKLQASTASYAGGLQKRAQNIGWYQTQLQNQLAGIDEATTRALGIAGIELQNLALNTAFVESMMELQFDQAQLVENLNLAANGQVEGLINMLLQIANMMQAGYV